MVKRKLNDKQINVLMAAAECIPFAKVGGLADVVGSLPKKLEKNINVEIIFPLYSHISLVKYKLKKQNNFTVNFANKIQRVTVFIARLPKSKVKIYFLQNKKFLSSGDIYIKGENDKNQQRFAFFSMAILEFIKTNKIKPNVLHLHDWHTGLLAKLIKTNNLPIKTLFTIHNLAMQGWWNKKSANKFLNHIEFNSQDYKKGKLNMLRLGILYADIINTVSPTYAQEILTNKFSEGLKKELLSRKKHLYGILNGLDTDRFNPETDKNIYKKFSVKKINYKQINKQKLQSELKLPTDKNIPLFGAVSRLYSQKGLDWVAQAAPKVIKTGAQIIILGTGDKILEKKFKILEKKHPKHFRALIKFDIKLAQKIYAASDLFLVPSRFEPCGLTQMMAMRYGAIPIVRSTGGLKDTVKNYGKIKREAKGDGFVFIKENYQELEKQMIRAVKIFADKKAWARLQKNAMNKNFSWEKSANEYLKIYKQLI